MDFISVLSDIWIWKFVFSVYDLELGNSYQFKVRG